MEKVALSGEGRLIINLLNVVRASFDLDGDYRNFWAVSQMVIANITGAVDPQITVLVLASGYLDVAEKLLEFGRSEN